jgi:hypothetical protein
MLIPDLDFFSIPEMGSRIQGSKMHRIPDPDPQHWIRNTVFPVQDLGVDTQVAQHLAATYGDRAFSVGKGGSHLCLCQRFSLPYWDYLDYSRFLAGLQC